MGQEQKNHQLCYLKTDYTCTNSYASTGLTLKCRKAGRYTLLAHVCVYLPAAAPTKIFRTKFAINSNLISLPMGYKGNNDTNTVTDTVTIVTKAYLKKNDIVYLYAVETQAAGVVISSTSALGFTDAITTLEIFED